MSPVNITALHDPISIVHIPVAVAPTYCTKLYWTLDRAASDSSEFFNLTSNRIEIALFASADLVEDEWSNSEPPVKINGPWRAFEITSGEDETSNDGVYDSPHLRVVSAPLAEAGVSILYQSSYFTDFLLVKSSDFDRASGVFKARGWHVDPFSVPPKRRSLLLAPDFTGPGIVPSPVPPAPPVAEITVLGTPLACIGLSADLEQVLSERMRKFLVWPERALLALRHDRGEHEGESVSSPKSHSHPRPFISYTRTEDGTSVLTEVRVLRSLLTPSEIADLGAPELEGSSGSDWCEESDDDEGESEETESNCSMPWSTNCSPSSPSTSASTSQTDLTHARSQSYSHHSLRTPTSLRTSSSHTPEQSITVPIHWASSSPPATPTRMGLGSTRRANTYGHGRARSESVLELGRTMFSDKSSGEIADEVDEDTDDTEQTGSRLEPDLRVQVQPDVDTGRIRCLQLDLRAVEDGLGVYHLGENEIVLADGRQIWIGHSLL